MPVWVCVGAVVRNNMKTNLLMNSIKFQHTKSIYENQVHFYTPTMHYSEKEIKKAISLIIGSKRITYLEINLIKEKNDMH